MAVALTLRDKLQHYCNKLIDSRNIKSLSLTHLMLRTGQPKYFAKNLAIFLSEVSVRSSLTDSSMLRMILQWTALYRKSFTVTTCRLRNYFPSPLRTRHNLRRHWNSITGSRCPRWVRFRGLIGEWPVLRMGKCIVWRNCKRLCSLFISTKRMFFLLSSRVILYYGC